MAVRIDGEELAREAARRNLSISHEEALRGWRGTVGAWDWTCRRLPARFRDRREDLLTPAALGYLDAANRWKPDGGRSFPAMAYLCAVGFMRNEMRTWRRQWDRYDMASLDAAPGAVERVAAPVQDLDLSLYAAQLLAAMRYAERRAVQLWLDGVSMEEAAAILGVRAQSLWRIRQEGYARARAALGT